MNKTELKEFLDEKAYKYNTTEFIETDPIQVPHFFKTKEDIEISAFLVALMAWGKRNIIIKKGFELMALMDHSPYDFVMNHTQNDLQVFKNFKHRTFIGEDFVFFIQSLQNIYQNHQGLEPLFFIKTDEQNPFFAFQRFRKTFFEVTHLHRSNKHIADTQKNAAAKRLNMFLRWMVRNDKKVDLGIWNSIPTNKLSCPLDVHSGRIGRLLGLIHSKQDNWKTVEELDQPLREMNPSDPVFYDFALLGVGVYEKF